MITRDVTLNSDGIDITGRLYLPHDDSGAVFPAVCISHGIPSGNPSDPNDGGYPRLAERVCVRGYAVFIYNFRGCGTSGGNLDIGGWKHDLKTAIDYLGSCPETDKSFLALIGFSAGAAVSVCVAAEDKRATGVIACACPAKFEFGDVSAVIQRFREIGAIRENEFPESIEEWTRGFRAVSPVDHVSRLAPRPLLLVHGEADETVDISHAERIYEKAGEPKELIRLPGEGHRLRRNEEVIGIIFRYLDLWGEKLQ